MMFDYKFQMPRSDFRFFLQKLSKRLFLTKVKTEDDPFLEKGAVFYIISSAYRCAYFVVPLTILFKKEEECTLAIKLVTFASPYTIN